MDVDVTTIWTDHSDEDCEFVICGGGAKPEDTHLLSTVHCQDEEIIEWLHRHEKARKEILDTRPRRSVEETLVTSDGFSGAQNSAEMHTTRSTICAKLARLGLKRGHKPPTAKPKIVAVPSVPLVAAPPPPAPLPAPVQPVAVPTPPWRAFVAGTLSRPVAYTKPQLRAMLAEAVRNTARL